MIDTMVNLLSQSMVLKLLMIAVCADTVLGVLRAIKYRKFNSSVGIDGAIRKVAMLVSAIALMAADVLIHINVIAFIPDQYIQAIGISKVGLCELFSLLFIAYEVVSILKNMVLCGLPVPKKVKEWAEEFLENMTAEMPDGTTEETVLEHKE